MADKAITSTADAAHNAPIASDVTRAASEIDWATLVSLNRIHSSAFEMLSISSPLNLTNGSSLQPVALDPDLFANEAITLMADAAFDTTCKLIFCNLPCRPGVVLLNGVHGACSFSGFCG